MIVSNVDFQNDVNKYFAMLGNEDLQITNDGKIIAVVTRPKALSSLRGVLSGITDEDIERFRTERILGNN